LKHKFLHEAGIINLYIKLTDSLIILIQGDLD